MTMKIVKTASPEKKIRNKLNWLKLELKLIFLST